MRKVLVILLLAMCSQTMNAQFRPPELDKLEKRISENQKVEKAIEQQETSAEYSRPKIIDPYDEASTTFRSADFLSWQIRQVEEKECRVSPTLTFGSLYELNHHRVTVSYTGSGTVQLSLAHSYSKDLNKTLEKKYLYSRFQTVKNNRETYIRSPYKNEHFVWLLLRIDGEVNIDTIRYTCLRGKRTLYGHVAGNFKFHNATLPYRLMYPKDYDPKKKYPLVLSVPSSGGIGTGNIKNMEMVNLGRYLFTNYFYDESFACFSLVPQIPKAEAIPAPYWPKGTKGGPSSHHPDTPLVNEQGWYTQASLALIRSILQDSIFSIDPNRIYLTGFSYGGKATWEFLRAAPDLFSGVVSAGGWSIGRLNANPTQALREALRQEVQIYKHVPVYVTAGELDVPMAKGSHLLHEVLTAEGGKCTYVEFGKTKHVPSAGKTWGDRKVIEWLFRQHRESEAN